MQVFLANFASAPRWVFTGGCVFVRGGSWSAGHALGLAFEILKKSRGAGIAESRPFAVTELTGVATIAHGTSFRRCCRAQGTGGALGDIHVQHFGSPTLRARRTPALSAARLFFEFPRNAVVAGRGPLLEWFARFNTGFALRFTRFVLVLAVGTFITFRAVIAFVLSWQAWETCRRSVVRLVLTSIACLALVRVGTVRVFTFGTITATHGQCIDHLTSRTITAFSTSGIRGSARGTIIARSCTMFRC